MKGTYEKHWARHNLKDSLKGTYPLGYAFYSIEQIARIESKLNLILKKLEDLN